MVRISSFLRGPRTIRRLGTIAQAFISHGLGFFVDRYVNLGYLPARFRLKSANIKRPEPESLPRHLTSVLEELGPTFVKLGQMLATRPDILSEEYIRAFRRVYYRVTPFDSQVAKEIVEEELKSPVEDVFATFTDEPRASGSIAQVHNATLMDGTPVVVKVRRPGIDKTVEDDLHILHVLADGANRIEELRPLRLPMIVDEFARGVRQELDFINEASTVSKFYKAFEKSDVCVVPDVYWEYSTARVLTLRQLQGRNFAQLEEENFQGVDRKQLANNLGGVFLTQIFEYGLFHADPHPGNLVLQPDGRIGLIDFGLVGTLTGDFRSKFSTTLIALARDQIDLAAEVFTDIGLLPGDVEPSLFKAQVSELFRKYYGIPMHNLDTQQLFTDLMRISRENNVIVPRDAVLLGKCLVTVSSVARELDRDVSIAELARPYAKHLVLEKFSRKTLEKRLYEETYHLSDLVLNGPRELRTLFKKLLGGQFELNIKHEGLDRHVSEIDRTGNRLALSVILASIIIGSSQILSSKIGPLIGRGTWQMSALGIFGYLLALALGLWLVIGIFRSGRL